MSTQTTNYGFIKDDGDEFYNILKVNSNLDKIDAEIKKVEERLTGDIAKYKSGNASFATRGTTHTVNDSFCTANSLVTIVINSAIEPQGIWSVNSFDGRFTISSDTAEIADIPFSYSIVKAVGK